jgi:hypothetical protein
MRWISLTMVICAALGCRSQSTPLTNPFLAPDRVPPPATGTLAPGTAQPYYAPGTPPGTAPFNTAPPATFSPASTPVTPHPTYTAPPSSAPLQTAPVTPPGGWGQTPAANPYGVQPTSGLMPAADNSPVRIAPDNFNVRFDGATPANTFAQTAANQQLVAQAPYVYAPPTVGPQNLNNMQPAQFAATSVPGTASDGFRPQGSGVRTDTPAISRPVGDQPINGPAENPNHFGFDATYGSLRGQLQYYPQSGHWGLRYVSLNSAPDPYGGVVVINNPEVLGGVQPGEFLLVQGLLETEDNFDGTFLPLYTIEGIQRQR